MAITFECETKPLGFNTLWRAPLRKPGSTEFRQMHRRALRFERHQSFWPLKGDKDLGSLWGLYGYLAVFAVLIIAD